VIGDPLVYAFVSQSVTLATVLTHSRDGAIAMRPLLHLSGMSQC